MNVRLYPKLAVSSMKKNGRLYFPYILTCIGMVMMFYIIHSLSYSPLIRQMRGGSNVEVVLTLGKFVIAVFALIFLTYTNSFLVRRRNKEFGLYNVLGMGKRGIMHIIVWESLIVAVVGIVTGLVLGIAFSKFAELGLLNTIKADIDYRFTISPEAISFTLQIFTVIFFLLLIKSLIQVGRSNPLDLMRSENVGEKPPKANWLLAVLGVVILGVAYYMAVSIKSPLEAMTLFFVAVILVIIATYMMFCSASVVVCRVLQKNKRYYYKKNHFVSVSSMAYRMKRNGAGLASICILSTMVLVMLSSTTSLYIGVEDTLRSRYPMENQIEVNINRLEDLDESRLSLIRAEYEKVFTDHGIAPEKTLEYRYAYILGRANGNAIEPFSNRETGLMFTYETTREIFLISVEEYNMVMGTDYIVEPGQALIYPMGCEFSDSTISIGNLHLDVVGRTKKSMLSSSAMVSIVPVIMVVISDYEELVPLATMVDTHNEPILTLKWYYGYNIDVNEEKCAAIFNEQKSAINNTFLNTEMGFVYSASRAAAEREDFYSTFGGLFFLGIILSIVFIFAAVLIIYYKQISEGYEDQSRFDIMQKVGMTKEDIKKSINSQVLTVFFAPLLFAGLHLAFAFPLVWKILQLFMLQDLTLVIIVTIISFIIFGIFYALVYKATAHSYYRIVSGANGYLVND